MKTVKLKLEIPTTDEIIAGLDLHSLHPRLGKAESALGAAEKDLEEARQRLADDEATVAKLPAEIRLGKAPANALTDAMRSRDGSALAIAPVEKDLEKARARVEAEQAVAEKKRAKEIEKRGASLGKIAKQLAPILEALKEADYAIGQAEGIPHTLCSGQVSWPHDWQTELALRGVVGAAAGAMEESVVPARTYNRR